MYKEWNLSTTIENNTNNVCNVSLSNIKVDNEVEMKEIVDISTHSQKNDCNTEFMNEKLVVKLNISTNKQPSVEIKSNLNLKTNDFIVKSSIEKLERNEIEIDVEFSIKDLNEAKEKIVI